MAKKSKKPAAEDLVDSILEDLQQDINEDEGSLNDEFTPTFGKRSAMEKAVLNNESLVPEETRHLPDGIEDATKVFGSLAHPQDDDPSRILQQDPEPSEEDLAGEEVSGEVSDDDVNPMKEFMLESSDGDKTMLAAPESSVPVPIEPPTFQGSNPGIGVSEDSATRKLPEESSITFKSDFTERTQPMIRTGAPSATPDGPTKLAHGFSRPLTKSSASLAASVTEAQMLQAENLRLAQTRILELEKEVEQLRQENELLASAGEIAKRKAEELFEKVQGIERMKIDALDHAQMEMNIYRENLVEKDKELARMRSKIEDLETRLAKDLKKIRVRERELENRLELAKMEKTALVRSKDEAILDLKNKVDQLHSELENYKARCAELNQKIDGQHEQLGRTVRALRLALTNLEANDSAGTVTPLKKAE
jgi:hypothetical protein